MLTILSGKSYERTYGDETDFYYRSYLEKYEGKITAAKTQSINKEKHRYVILHQNAKKEKSVFVQEELNKEFEREKGFQIFLKHIGKMTAESEIYDDTVIREILGEPWMMQFVQQMLIFICGIAFCLVQLWYMDTRKGYQVIITPTVNGLKRMERIKNVISILLMSILFVIVFLIPYIRIQFVYKALPISYVVGSSEKIYSRVKWGTFGTFFFVYYGVIYGVGLLMTFGIKSLMKKNKGEKKYD